MSHEPSSVGSLLLLVAGLVLVVGGANAFFNGLIESSRRLRLSPFAVTAVISGFELENLAAGIAANAKGLSGAAAGTFLGGTTFLALGVAGTGALIAPMKAALPRAVLLWTASAPLPLLLLSLDGRLSRFDGALLLAWFAIALAGIVRAGRSLVSEAVIERARFGFLRLAGGLVVLSVGGELLGEGIKRTVTRFGVSQTLLGNTAIAASVEAEELARVTVPTRRGRSEIGLANIAGTIVHFITFNAGVIALVRPIELDDPTRYLHLPMAVAAPLLTCAVLWLGRGIGRGAGATLLAVYLAYVAAAIVVAATG